MSINLDQAIANATQHASTQNPTAVLEVLSRHSDRETVNVRPPVGHEMVTHAERIQQAMLAELQSVTGRSDFTALTSAEDTLRRCEVLPGMLSGHQARFAASCGTVYIVKQFETLVNGTTAHTVVLSVTGAADPDHDIQIVVQDSVRHLDALLVKRDWENRHQD